MLIGFLFEGGVAKAATEVEIPTASGSYINWGNADLTKCSSENNGASVGSTGSSTVITFNIKNTVAQDYVMSFLTGAKNLTAELGVAMTDGTTNYLDATASVANTGAWTPVTPQTFIIKSLPVGSYTLTIKVNSTTGKYAGNYGNLAFTPLSEYDKAPGTLTLTKGVYNGPQYESSNNNIGYIQDGGTAKYTFYNQTAGGYNLAAEIYRYNSGGKMNIAITDNATGREEVNQDYSIASDAPASYTATTIPLIGSLSEGLKTLTLTFSGGSSYICNYRNLSLEYAGTLAAVTGVNVNGEAAEAGTTSDWLYQLPASYTDATTTLSVAATNGTATLTAKDEDGNDVAVTANADGTFSLPTPALNKTTTVTIALKAADGASAVKDSYTLQLFHIGSVDIKSITVGGVDESSLIDALNGDSHSATLSSKVYTAVPSVVATLIDGSTVTAEVTLSGTTATYNIKGTIDKLSQNFTLTVEGVHAYTAASDDQTVDLKYTSAGKASNGVWSNGLYTLTTTGLDGWENSSFKLNGTDYTLTLPADVKVKQIIFKDLKSNYQPSDGAGLSSVASDGATVYLPSKHDYSNSDDAKYDLVVNLENHKAGTPITFSINGGGQPTTWLELVVEKTAITTAPEVKSQTVTVVNNHAVVALSFDREMKATKAIVNNQTVEAEGGSSTLYFSVWDLDWNTTNNLVVATGAAADNYGNSNAADITIPVTIGAKPTVEKAAYDYVVSTVDELKSALAAVKESNKSADAARKVIFVKNGTYDLGSEGQSLDAYNVSLIGESEDNVIIKGNRDGITNAVFNIGSKTGVYIQDVTFYNENNYNTDSKRGVAVALSGGNKAVLKKVRMLSTQDTQVTGSRAYYEDCDIHGTVDFICGGGDHFFYNTNLAIELAGSVIAAPNTSSQNKWGYVFQHCTISNASADRDANGSYSLGRPWQNEPRTYFLNTKMLIKPSDNGWAKMSDLTTHFYEYNSVDADGNAIDLSKRGNSPSSTNTYTPVLTDEEAAKFTLKNVLGGTDSWLPTEQTVEAAAVKASISGTTLSWTATDDARNYVIFRNGEYVANTTETSYSVTEDGVYTVRAANLMGGMGAASNEVAYGKVATVTIKEGFQRTTFSSQYPIDFSKTSGLKAYVITATANSSATAEEVTDVPANTGVIVEGTAGSYDLYAGSAVTLDKTNLLVAATDAYTVNDGETVYGYGKKNDVEGFYRYAAGRTVSAGKAYLSLPSSSTAKEFIAFFSTTTGINNVIDANADSLPQVEYNLSGQRVDDSYRGIVIKNGKKVIRK